MTTASAPLPAKRRRRSITRKNRAAFLEALAAGWAVRHAAELAGHGFQRWYELKAEDEDFAAAFAEAEERGVQAAEDEAWRRATEGYDEETFDGEGNLIRRVRRYSDSLLMQRLKAKRVEYRDGATVEVNTPAVFVLESSFARPGEITVVPAEPPLELPRGET